MFTATLENKKYAIAFNNKENTSGKINDVDFAIDIAKKNKQHFNIISNNQSYNIEVLKIDKETKTVDIKINGKQTTILLQDQFDVLLKSLGLDNLTSKKISDLKAPMPGLVLEIMVTNGQSIAKGDPLIVLEAMKMENIIKSPTDGVVKKINITKGVAVEKNQVLMQFV